MKKILLKDLLNFSSEQIEKVKVKFNQHNGDTNPMEEYIKVLDFIGFVPAFDDTGAEKITKLFNRKNQ